MTSSRLLVLLLWAVLSSCSTKTHEAEGIWRATLVAQGNTVELGTLTIGADFIEIPYFKMQFRSLQFSSRGNEIRFDRDKNVSFSGADSNHQQGATGSIKRRSARNAEMTLDHIQGVIQLSR